MPWWTYTSFDWFPDSVFSCCKGSGLLWTPGQLKGSCSVLQGACSGLLSSVALGLVGLSIHLRGSSPGFQAH